MQAVLNFMYHGEVNVAQDELNSFLAVAEDLKVKGLTQSNSSSDGNSSYSKPKSETTNNSVPVPRPRPHRQEEPSTVSKRPHPAPPPQAQPTRSYQEDDDIQEVMPIVKQEPFPEPAPPPQPLVTQQPQEMYQPTHSSAYQDNTVAQLEESYGDDGYDYGGYEGDEYGGAAGTDYQGKGFYSGAGADFHLLESMITVLENGLYVCTQCGKEQKNKKDLKRHVARKHIQGPIVSCQFCEKEFKNQPSLQVHISQHHRDEYSTVKQQF